MRTSGGLQVVVAVLLVVVTLSPLLVPFGDTTGSSPVNDPGPVETGLVGGDTAAAESLPSVDTEVRVVASLDPGVESPREFAAEYDVSPREDGRQLSGHIPLSGVSELSAQRGVQSVLIEQSEPDRPLRVGDEAVSPAVDAVGATELHHRGTLGGNVTVGVVDSGFKLDHPAIAHRVGAYRTFSWDGSKTHGTAVAGAVGHTAPNATLHLAAVGPDTTAEEYEAAVEWLRESGVDVIVDAGSYFGQSTDGPDSISAVAAEAAGDVPFVTSAGNYADRHWTGTHSPDMDSEWVEFASGSETNALADGQEIAGDVSLGLHWNGSANYDLYLMRESAAGDWVWASSTGGDDAEHISTVVPRGRYYVTVEADDVDRPHRIQLFSNQDLEHRVAEGSLTAPATAEGVIAVGAADGDDAEAFSSRGPTFDGDRGVDVVAPDDVRVAGVETGGGTSFAAAYVAGTIALIQDHHPDLPSEEVVALVLVSASDVGTEGPDPATGHGLVDAATAVDLAHHYERTAALHTYRFDDD